MKKIICLTTLLAISTILFSYQIVAQPTHQNIVHKKLTNEKMKLVNMLLEENGTYTARCKLTFDTSKKIYLEKQIETKDINSHLQKLLDPIKQFFSTLQAIGPEMVPLVEESISATARKEDSILIKFTRSKIGIIDFCEKEITSQEKLKNLCLELQQLLGDVLSSLSKEAKIAYKEFITKIKK